MPDRHSDEALRALSTYLLGDETLADTLTNVCRLAATATEADLAGITHARRWPTRHRRVHRS